MQQQQRSVHKNAQNQQQQAMTIQQLRDSVRLSSSKLLQLAYSERNFLNNQEKYIDTILDFNIQAISHINAEQHEQALVYLAEAERTLEYGASCGKAIDRNLIICILNNEACCHYRQGQLTKCASYLQGVIYNLKAFGTSMETSPSGSNYLQNQKNKNFDEFYHVSLQKKIQLVHYFLRYCTINSQLTKRQIAMKAGQNVVKLVKALFTDVMFQNPKIYPQNENEASQQQLTDIKQLIKNQTFLKQKIQPQQIDLYRKLARIYVKKWNERKLSNKMSRQLEKNIRDYSISEVIEIVPLNYISSSDILYQNVCNSKVLMRQFLHLAMGYFTISTEYRLLAQHRYPSMEERMACEEWKSANIYHLFGIIYLAINLNSDLLFMKQLISSYEQHYKTQILLQEHLSDQQLQSLSQRLLFQPKRQKLSKKNQLLLQKIVKLKEKQQNRSKNKSFKKRSDKSINKSINKSNQYQTLNSNKLNLSKDQTNIRKRSLSKQQQNQVETNKNASQKKIINTAQIYKVNNTLQKQQQTKKSVRKRSYSKDSVKKTKLSPQPELKKSIQVQRTATEYQLQTPDKKMTPTIKKRRISSISSTKDTPIEPKRQFSKNNKIFRNQIKSKNSKTDKEKFKSPNAKLITEKNTKFNKGQKIKDKNAQKQTKTDVKSKKKPQKGDKPKQTKRKTPQLQSAYYF